MKRFLFCAAVLMFFTATLAHSETVEEMLSACRPIAEAPVSDGQVTLPPTLKAGLCWGAFEMIQQMSRWTDKTGKRVLGICTPARSTRTQLIAIFVEYAKRNPQRYSEEFADVAVDALVQSFPCSVSPPTK